MLGNKKAGELINILEKFVGTNILIDCQIVLCPGINDGTILERTISELSEYYPNVRTVGIVPAGITKYRENLHKIKKLTLETAGEIIDFIQELQTKFLEKLGTRLVFLSDEFYITGKRELPKYEEYEEFYQIENGIGMIRLFQKEFAEALEKSEKTEKEIQKTAVLTGEMSYGFITEMINSFKLKYTDADIDVIAVKNNFFGGNVNVSGLITGKDIVGNIIKGKYRKIIIPSNMLKADEQIFLDDMSTEELQEKVKSKIYISETEGKVFLQNILGEKDA